MPFLRLPIQVFFFIFEKLMDAVEWVQNLILSPFFKTEYVRKGQCQMTGQCCRSVGMELPKSWMKSDRMKAFFKRWHKLRYNFDCIGETERMLVYECRYQKGNRCGIHRFKPKLCRDYPKASLFGKPKLHKGCGYSFLKRGAQDFGSVLEDKKKKS